MSNIRVQFNFRAADMLALGQLGKISEPTVNSICALHPEIAEPFFRERSLTAATLVMALLTEIKAKKPRVSMLRKLSKLINRHPVIMAFDGHVDILEPADFGVFATQPLADDECPKCGGTTPDRSVDDPCDCGGKYDLDR